MDWANLAEIVGAAAIVATLIDLSAQIRQNTNAPQSQARQTIAQNAQAEILFMASNPEIVLSLSKPGPLTPEENT